MVESTLLELLVTSWDSVCVASLVAHDEFLVSDKSDGDDNDESNVGWR